MRKLFVDIVEFNRAFRMIESPIPDPRPMLAIIARFTEANTRVGGLIISAHDAIAGFPWDILPSDPNDPQAVAIAAAMKERFIRAGIHHHFDVIIDGEFFGMTGIRQVWTAVDGKWQATVGIVATTDICPIRNAEGIQETCLIQDNAMFKALPIPSAERNQYILSEFNPHKSTRPDFIGGLCRGAIPLTIIRQINWEDWSRYNETFAEPFRVGHYKEGAADKDKDVAKKALKEFGRNAWAFVSEDIRFELMEAARAGTMVAYKQLIEDVDKELEVLIKGEASTTQLPNSGGSRAALQILKMTADDRMWARCARIQDTINEQHIAVDYSLNESTTNLSLRPRFEFITEAQADFESNARIVTDLRGAGYVLDDAEVSAKTGFKVTGGNTPEVKTVSPSPFPNNSSGAKGIQLP